VLLFLTVSDAVNVCGWLADTFVSENCVPSYIIIYASLCVSSWTAITGFHLWRVVTLRPKPSDVIYHIFGWLFALPFAIASPFTHSFVLTPGWGCWLNYNGQFYYNLVPKTILMVFILLFFVLVQINLKSGVYGRYADQSINANTKLRLYLMLIVFMIPYISVWLMEIYELNTYYAAGIIASCQGIFNAIAILYPVAERKVRRMIGYLRKPIPAIVPVDSQEV